MTYEEENKQIAKEIKELKTQISKDEASLNVLTSPNGAKVYFEKFDSYLYHDTIILYLPQERYRKFVQSLKSQIESEKRQLVNKEAWLKKGKTNRAICNFLANNPVEVQGNIIRGTFWGIMTFYFSFFVIFGILALVICGLAKIFD